MDKREPFRRWRRSLSGKLLLSGIGLHAVLASALLGAVLTVVVQGMRQQFVQDAAQTAGLLAAMTADQPASADRELLRAFLQDVSEGGQVVYAELALPGSEVLMARRGAKGAVVAYHEDLTFGDHGDHTYFLEIPVRLVGQSAPALLRLGFDERPVASRIRMMTAIVAGLAGIYLLYTVLWLSATGQRISQPIKSLRAATRRIIQGKTNTSLDVHSAFVEIHGLSQDLNEMRETLIRQANALEHQALHDALTGLPNRLLFQDRLEQAILNGSRARKSFALLIMDLNRFKEVNDTLGHHAGDDVLRQATARMRAFLRTTDSVARLGGDEFAILLADSSEAEAHRLAMRLTQRMEQAFEVDGHILSLGASVGIALYPAHGDYASQLLQRADIAMYAAKREGRAVQAYDSTLDGNSVEVLALRQDLREGIRRGELRAFYQPVLDVKTGDLAGAEVLVRWLHPRHGLLAPDRFVPLAERTGLIQSLTEEVLTLAVRDCRDWCVRTGRRIAVNLSPLSLRETGLAQQLVAILGKAGFPADHLNVEITESTVLYEARQARKNLDDLRALGIAIMIDDFGTGFSSLSRLKHMPVTDIKIDKSFVRDMMVDRDDAAIVRATITMAHDLGLSVVAEGVEHYDTLQALAELGCDKIQGYLLSQPMSGEDFARWREQFTPMDLSADAGAGRRAWG